MSSVSSTETVPKATLRNVYHDFLTEMDRFSETMADLLDGADRDALAHEAHRMAGSAAVFGARALNIKLRHLQEAAANASEATLTNLGQDLRTCWHVTKAALHESEAAVLQSPALQEMSTR